MRRRCVSTNRHRRLKLRKNICCMQRTFPIASRPLSKKNITPIHRKRTPKAVSPTPISAGEKKDAMSEVVVEGKESIYELITL